MAKIICRYAESNKYNVMMPCPTPGFKGLIKRGSPSHGSESPLVVTGRPPALVQGVVSPRGSGCSQISSTSKNQLFPMKTIYKPVCHLLSTSSTWWPPATPPHREEARSNIIPERDEFTGPSWHEGQQASCLGGACGPQG